MPKICFTSHDGVDHVVDAETGTSLMHVARDNDVPGIDGDCGGDASCGTCHVMVDPDWLNIVGLPNDMEDAMLDMNPDRAENSRLCCQIELTDKHDGLKVMIPEFQM